MSTCKIAIWGRPLEHYLEGCTVGGRQYGVPPPCDGHAEKWAPATSHTVTNLPPALHTQPPKNLTLLSTFSHTLRLKWRSALAFPSGSFRPAAAAAALPPPQDWRRPCPRCCIDACVGAFVCTCTLCLGLPLFGNRYLALVSVDPLMM